MHSEKNLHARFAGMIFCGCRGTHVWDLLEQGLTGLTHAAGLVIFGVIILPLAFWFITRRKPTEVARGFSKALVLAFGTSSSSAALPVSPLLKRHVSRLSVCCCWCMNKHR